MFMKPYFAKKISWLRALCWILGSGLLFSFLGYKVIDYSFTKKRKRAQKETISYIIQTGPQKEAVLSDYLAELLDLSIDKPTSFRSFSLQEAKAKLARSPILSEVQIKKIKPNMLYVDYTVRKPSVWWIDFFNTALDKEGFFIPVHPFFSPKKMPEIYLGEEGLKQNEGATFGQKVKGSYFELAFSVLELLQDKGKDLFFVKRVDVSQAFAPSLGKREIIVVIENEIYFTSSPTPFISTHFLRLTTKQYPEEIANYLKLRDHLLETEKQGEGISFLGDKVIDLKLPSLAFIDSFPKEG